MKNRFVVASTILFYEIKFYKNMGEAIKKDSFSTVFLFRENVDPSSAFAKCLGL